jgi:hypothetical protein
VVRNASAPQKCSNCPRVFCGDCIAAVFAGHRGGVIDWSAEERYCKPWSSVRGRCEYHEHRETTACKFEGWDAAIGHSVAGR